MLTMILIILILFYACNCNCNTNTNSNIYRNINTKSKIVILYISQKQLPREMKSRLVITFTECVGYILWQLFL